MELSIEHHEITEKYIVNPKVQYNLSNINYIPELLLTNSVVVDGELLEV